MSGQIPILKTKADLIRFSTTYFQARYFQAFFFYFAKSINEILANIKSQNVIQFKEICIYNIENEYLRRYYTKNESQVRLTNYTAYLKNMNATYRPKLPLISQKDILHKRTKRIVKLLIRQHGPNMEEKEPENHSSTQNNNDSFLEVDEKKILGPNSFLKLITAEVVENQDKISFETVEHDIYNPSYSSSNDSYFEKNSFDNENKELFVFPQSISISSTHFDFFQRNTSDFKIIDILIDNKLIDVNALEDLSLIKAEGSLNISESYHIEKNKEIHNKISAKMRDFKPNKLANQPFDNTASKKALREPLSQKIASIKNLNNDKYMQKDVIATVSKTPLKQRGEEQLTPVLKSEKSSFPLSSVDETRDNLRNSTQTGINNSTINDNRPYTHASNPLPSSVYRSAIIESKSTANMFGNNEKLTTSAVMSDAQNSQIQAKSSLVSLKTSSTVRGSAVNQNKIIPNVDIKNLGRGNILDNKSKKDVIVPNEKKPGKILNINDSIRNACNTASIQSHIKMIPQKEIKSLKMQNIKSVKDLFAVSSKGPQQSSTALENKKDGIIEKKLIGNSTSRAINQDKILKSKNTDIVLKKPFENTKKTNNSTSDTVSPNQKSGNQNSLMKNGNVSKESLSSPQKEKDLKKLMVNYQSKNSKNSQEANKNSHSTTRGSSLSNGVSKGNLKNQKNGTTRKPNNNDFGKQSQSKAKSVDSKADSVMMDFFPTKNVKPSIQNSVGKANQANAIMIESDKSKEIKNNKIETHLKTLPQSIISKNLSNEKELIQKIQTNVNGIKNTKNSINNGIKTKPSVPNFAVKNDSMKTDVAKQVEKQSPGRPGNLSSNNYVNLNSLLLQINKSHHQQNKFSYKNPRADAKKQIKGIMLK